MNSQNFLNMAPGGSDIGITNRITLQDKRESPKQTELMLASTTF